MEGIFQRLFCFKARIIECNDLSVLCIEVDIRIEVSLVICPSSRYERLALFRLESSNPSRHARYVKPVAGPGCS